MKHAPKFLIALFSVWGVIAVVAFPVAWFIGEMNVSWVCNAPPPSMVLDCAHSRIKANRVRSTLMWIALSGGLLFAGAVAGGVVKDDANKKPPG